MSALRAIVLVEHLPDRDPLDRIPHIREDVTKARDEIYRKLTDRATTLHVSGWVDDPNGIQLSVRDRSIVGVLELSRPD